MTAITFPTTSTVGQEYVATNAITYTWTGDRWSSREAMVTGQSRYYVEGGDSGFEYDPMIDNELDGGTA